MNNSRISQPDGAPLVRSSSTDSRGEFRPVAGALSSDSETAAGEEQELVGLADLLAYSLYHLGVRRVHATRRGACPATTLIAISPGLGFCRSSRS